MIKVKFRRPRVWNSLPSKYSREMTKAVSQEIVLGLDIALEAIEETPVYTGRTLANYRFSAGTRIDDARAAIATPPLPGKTSEMELGKEPRRAANWSLVLAEHTAVVQIAKSSPYQKFFMTNNTPYFLEVEYGSYKTSEGHSVRTPPGGMVRRAETTIAQRLRR